MKNIKKVSNYTLAGLLAVGVMLLSFFAYQEKIQADTIIPGFATAHVNIHVTVPTLTSVPFKATFLPISYNAGGRFYYKERSFTLTAAGLNTIDWYIRKMPAGTYKVILESNGKEVSGSPYEAVFSNDKVNETTSFNLNLGEPVPSPVPSPIASPITTPAANLPDPGYEGADQPADPSPDTSNNDAPPTPGDSNQNDETYGPF